MVPAPTYQNLPTFGTGASLVQPIAGTYNGGFLPGQLFPAEYENWLMNYITANSNTSQTSVVNLVAEMGTILAAASITPSAGLTNQLYAALNALYLTLTGGTLTGGLTLGGVLNMASHKITNITDPTNAQDGATQNYVLTQSSSLQSNINAQSLVSDAVYTSALSAITDNNVLSDMAVGETRYVSISRHNASGFGCVYIVYLPAGTSLKATGLLVTASSQQAPTGVAGSGGSYISITVNNGETVNGFIVVKRMS